MTKDLQAARAVLEAGNCTCALCKGEQVYQSALRGVAPLLSWLDSGINLHGFAAADKVVGKAAAFLYCLLGVSQVYAPVMSRAAAEVLEAHGIAFYYDILTKAVLNHRKNGFCPMETATKALSDPADALAAIRQTLANMK